MRHVSVFNIPRQPRRDGKGPWLYGVHLSQEPVAQGVREGGNPNHGQHAKPIPPQHLPKGNKPCVVAHEPFHPSTEDGSAHYQAKRAPHHVRDSNDGPSSGETVKETRNGNHCAVAYKRWESRCCRKQKDDEPATRQGTPRLGHGIQPLEYLVTVHKECGTHGRHHQRHHDDGDALRDGEGKEGPPRVGKELVPCANAFPQYDAWVLRRGDEGESAGHPFVAAAAVLPVGQTGNSVERVVESSS